MALGQVWTDTKISPSPGIDIRTVELVASRYTGYATPVHVMEVLLLLFLTSALDGSKESTSGPGGIGSQKNPNITIEWEADCAPEVVWMLW